MRAAHTVYRRHCPDQRWPARAPTGRRTPPRRSIGDSVTSSPLTALHAMHGVSGKHTGTTKRIGLLPYVDLAVIHVTALLCQFRRKAAVVDDTIACRQHPACDGCPDRRVPLNL